MVQWSDNAYILRTRSHGEYNLIVDVMTERFGRAVGLIKSGKSKKNRGVIQIGNQVSVNWQARLEEHLGVFQIELLKDRSAILMQSKLSLYALKAISNLTCLACAERQIYPNSYQACNILIDYLHKPDIWPALYVLWEFGLLAELGYAIDINRCALTGTKENLAFISPKSGKAACYEAGKKHEDKLLKLPKFLIQHDEHPNLSDIKNGFYLTGYFLEKHVLWPLNHLLPEERNLMIQTLKEIYSGNNSKKDKQKREINIETS